MQRIRQSEATAARRRIPVALVDDTDGKTPETGQTLSAGDLKISKAGGAEANHAGTLTELAAGDYYYEPTTGECDTLGYLTGRITKSGCRVFRFAVLITGDDNSAYDEATIFLDKGTTSYSAYFTVSSTNGGPLTGLVFNASGLTAYQTRQGAAEAAITLATQTAGGAWSSGGLVLVGDTNSPGLMRFDVPNAVLATGVQEASVIFKGAANMRPFHLKFILSDPISLSGTYVQASIKQVDDSAALLAKLVKNLRALATVTCGSGGSTTSIVASAIDPASSQNDQFNGRVFIFDDDTVTAALRGVARAVTDFAHASQAITVATLPAAPADGDKGAIF